METLQVEPIAIQYDILLESEPKLVTNFVPENATEQRNAFLKGQIRNPDHVYARLNGIDFEQTAESIEQIGRQILDNPELDPKFSTVYGEFITGYTKKTRMMQLAYEFKQTQDIEQRDTLKREYMELNIELYGKPDEATYQSLLQEKLQTLNKKELTGDAARVRDELFQMVSFDPTAETIPRFRPEDETIEWMQEVVDTLYTGMLSRIPDQASFTVSETKETFEAIIREEFGEAAEGWTVDIEEAKSINVKAGEKRVVIPNDRGDISRKKLQELVVHEIGVHMLRAVVGGETNLHPLKNGLDDYYEAEEGLGKVMEQALKGMFVEAGIDSYVTAGLAYYGQKDFRDIFEVKWRLAALQAADESGTISEEAIEKAKKSAYSGTMRILRGTDELPWFKDISYYNGSVDMWGHLESIRGDDVKFMFVLMGKANPANRDHERIQYETATV